MRVVLFRTLRDDPNKSMSLYFEELSKELPKTITSFVIKSKFFPIIKNYFSKEIIYPFAAQKNQGDINHILDHSYAGLLSHLDTKKTIVTCHDLIPLEMPGSTSFLGRLRFFYNVRNLKNAARIIADSEETKKSVIKFFNYPEDKIKVIYLGVSKNFRVLKNKKMLREKYKIPHNSVLSVGSCYPRKNLEAILHAMIQDNSFFLVRVGEFNNKQKKFIEENNLSKRIISFYNISEKELIELYNSVDIFVMPSLAEGFGLPVLEAMACGCPVICSDIPVFRELFTGAVEFFDLNDSSSLLNKIKKVLNSENVRKGMTKPGKNLSKIFIWKKTAEETYKVYREVYDENKK